MNALTERQAEVLRYIIAYQALNGYAPTLENITQTFNWGSRNAAAHHLKAIAKKGYLSLKPGAARTIRVLRRVDGSSLAERCPFCEREVSA